MPQGGENQLREHLLINYATEDWALAEWLTRKLSAEGYRVWCDRFKLLGGESYPREIDDAIKNRTFRMLSLLSRGTHPHHRGSRLRHPRPHVPASAMLGEERFDVGREAVGGRIGDINGVLGTTATRSTARDRGRTRRRRLVPPWNGRARTPSGSTSVSATPRERHSARAASSRQ
jgi:hypothetical protein